MADETQPQGADIPLLPQGIVLFTSLPMRAVVVEALAPAVQDGIVIARADARIGIVLIRDARITDVHAIDGNQRPRGDDALQRIRQWRDAWVSAHRLDPAILDIVPALFSGTVCYDDLHVEWLDLHALLDDLRSRPGTYVVELHTPRGSGVTAFRDGAHLLTYSGAATGPPALLDELVALSTGTVRVRRLETQSVDSLDGAMVHLFGRAQPVITAPDIAQQHEARLQTRQLVHLEAELKALVRARLQRSAGRAEQLIDDAVAGEGSLESIARTIRGTAIRGVAPSSMESLADEMLALSRPPGRDQSFLPA